MEQNREQQEQKTPITQLFDDLPISIRKLADELELNEVTLARVRDGLPARKPTINKILRYFSELYSEKYTLRNVSGITPLTFKKQNRSTDNGEPIGEEKKDKHAA